MEEYVESKADKIRRLLAIGELSRTQIAKEVGCSRPYVTQISLRGQRSITLADVMEELSEIKAILRIIQPVVKPISRY